MLIKLTDGRLLLRSIHFCEGGTDFLFDAAHQPVECSMEFGTADETHDRSIPFERYVTWTMRSLGHDRRPEVFDRGTNRSQKGVFVIVGAHRSDLTRRRVLTFCKG